ncbi:2-amino-4-hydroxy-6-hydroxymethyldihydropteridine diphosphokinase [Streptococcus loxodontisalivarius]|uniref:2-amino-4-hydroxy-6-hydroxymethyldihydropteridine diphosphokinase n=1 Tax=Streptococcus loxodontisalivarius TaxID=1349415 RepID=A0ABS2PT91_9STRE|nr:2-amino-4-hydroxy-6-hydroxymethyldihydropteridine diphosphokinase [Streptococcus loxodontisalivarius]MBM7642940.1 2-amino-4-hydroxy-6-hydroxymethyldihydropteridine diphosphokinase [Streptococcus loxodontisalivarius]
MTLVYLSLGSNMGDKRAYLERALQLLNDLPQTKVVAVSSFYQTAAWGKTDQDDFLNLACQLETDLDKFDLLRYCQKIEKDLDRVRHEHWGPRTIDIDMLLYGQDTSDVEELRLPHPFMKERAFVLVPLLEIAPDLTEPVLALPYADALSLLDASQVEVVD